MSAWGAARDVAAQLTAAGVRATTDPDDAHAPVVLVQPVSVTPTGSCLTVELQLSVSAGGMQPGQLAWLWDTAVPTILATTGAESVTTDPDLDGLPIVTATIERAT